MIIMMTMMTIFGAVLVIEFKKQISTPHYRKLTYKHYGGTVYHLSATSKRPGVCAMELLGVQS